MLCIGTLSGGIVIFVSAMHTIDVVCTIVSVDTVSYIWCFICFHFQCE